MRRRPTKEQFHQQLDQLVSTLRSEIVEGNYVPGDYLPPEKSLAARFGMSNNSIRAGLELLVQQGWIEKVSRVGNRVAATRPPVKLKLVSSNEMPSRNLGIHLLLEEFHRQYPWITVELAPFTANPDKESQKWEPISGDLVLLENSQFQYLTEARGFDLLEELTEKPDLYPQATKLFRAQGRLYMQPLIFSPIVLCYNREHFRECGMLEPDGSWTWDDLIRNAEKLSDGKGRYGFCFHVLSINRWPVFLLQSGERFEWDGANLRNLRGTKLLESMMICKRILHNRQAFPLYLSENHDEIDRMFLEGRVSMTLSSYMAMNGWKQAEFEYDISPVPHMEELRTLVISLGIGVSRQSLHKEEALLLVDFLTSEYAQDFIRRMTLSIPSLGTLPAHADDAKVYRPSRYMMYREVMSSLRTHSDLNIPHQLFGRLESELKAYWAGLLNEDELCDRLSKGLSIDGTAPRMASHET